MNAVIKTTATGTIVGPNAVAALQWDVASLTLRLVQSVTAVIASSTSSITSGVGGVVETQYNSSTGAWSFWINRTSAGSGTQTATLSSSNGMNLCDQFGISGNAEYFDGSIGEIIMYDLSGGIPSGSRTSIENNQQTYWGTP
jgi:hypothetical protein